MKKIIAGLLIASFFATAPAMVMAAPCKDAKGKFIKCPVAKPPVAKVKCRDAKGKFIKCHA